MSSTKSKSKKSKKSKPNASKPESKGAKNPPGEFGPAGQAWVDWQKHLAKRKSPVWPLPPMRDKKLSPLFWALPDGWEESESTEWVTRLHLGTASRKSVSKKRGLKKSAETETIDRDAAERWLADHFTRCADIGQALQCLAWAHALPALSQQLDGETWWAVLEALLSTTQEAAGIRLTDEPLMHQLMAVELPTTLAYLFDDLPSCQGLRKPAAEAFSAAAESLLDGEGMPASQYWNELRPLLACWTRTRLMDEQSPQPAISDDARLQFDWLVRQAMRTARRDGTQALTSGSAGRWCKPLFAAALSLSDDDDDRQIATTALPRQRGKSAAEALLPESAEHSPWSQTGSLRPRWSRKTVQATVKYPGLQLLLELADSRQPIISGEWTCEVRCNDQVLQPTSEWEEVCWFSDDEAQYLELEIQLDKDFRIQRQIMIAGDAEIAFLADAVLGAETTNISYASKLPLVDGLTFHKTEETNEAYLGDGKKRTLLLPLALPEWRSGSAEGSLSASDGCLSYQLQRTGVSLYAPLLIDLNSKRSGKACTWRRLTVAQKLEIQPPDVAVGYRARVGDDQWLFYRAMARRANRTFCGQNLSSEFMAGELTDEGEVNEFVEVE